MSKTLRDWVPPEFFNEHHKSPAARFLDVEIVEEISGEEALSEKAWPGRHINVFQWCRLTNGYGVGFNENPSRGWSFPVVKLK